MLITELHRVFRPRGIAFTKGAAVACVLWGGALVAQSQEPSTAPVPHSHPELPGTHVQPDSVLKKPAIELHVEGPFVVEQKRCKKDSFEIKYTVANRSTAPANGTILATLNGAALTPVGSAKLSQLQPGKVTPGAFTACCPASGLFPLRLEYRADAGQKAAERVSSAADPVNISCK